MNSGCRLLLIDGNNLLHRGVSLSGLTGDFRAAREKLTLRLRAMASALPETLLVYEGVSDEEAWGTLKVVYAGKGKSADAYIERFVAHHAAPSHICVVASDRAILEAVAAVGASTLACGAFYDWLHDEEHSTQRHHKKSQKKHRPHRLGDYFPE